MAELALVEKLRRAAELEEEQEKLAKKMPDLEKKARQAQAELDNVRWQLQDVKQEENQLLSGWTNQVAAYESLRAGPKLQELRRALGGAYG